MKIKPADNIEVGKDGYYIFLCQGCDSEHTIPLEKGEPRTNWGWNGSVDSPTIRPSILVNVGRKNPTIPICHSYITDGKIQFLSDCTHPLAGQTIELKALK